MSGGLEARLDDELERSAQTVAYRTHVGVSRAGGDELGDGAEDEEVPVAEGGAAGDLDTLLGAPVEDERDEALKGGVLLWIVSGVHTHTQTRMRPCRCWPVC